MAQTGVPQNALACFISWLVVHGLSPGVNPHGTMMDMWHLRDCPTAKTPHTLLCGCFWISQVVWWVESEEIKGATGWARLISTPQYVITFKLISSIWLNARCHISRSVLNSLYLGIYWLFPRKQCRFMVSCITIICNVIPWLHVASLELRASRLTCITIIQYMTGSF